MDPAAVRAKLRDTATDHACPTPSTVDYTVVGRPASWNAECLGTAAYNGFYGDGIVNAQAAIGGWRGAALAVHRGEPRPGDPSGRGPE